MNKPLANIAVASTLIWASLSAYAEVTVTDAWVRGVVKGQTETGAFMKLKSTEATALVGGTSPVAKTVLIHEMKMKGEVMTMRPVKSLELAANKTLEFDTDGYHLMLIGLKKRLVKGDMVPIKLNFRGKDGSKSTLEIQAEVRALTEPGESKEMDHMHMKH